MANKKVGIFARVNEKGKQKPLKAEWIGNARLKPVPGGVYWLKWLQGTQQKYHRVGSDPNDAVAAQLHQERLLAGENPPEGAGKPNRKRLSDAIEVFLLEKSDPRSNARWRWDLDQFASVCGRTYLDEIDRGDARRLRRTSSRLRTSTWAILPSTTSMSNIPSAASRSRQRWPGP
jgi:hypothetical protein